MSINLSSLGNLATAETINLDDYKDQEVKTFQLPKAGRYTLRAPERFSESDFAATKEGYLKARVDPTIVGPTNEGFQIRYVSVSAKTFDRGGARVSQVGDYLRACGVAGQLPSDPQGIADAIAGTAGLTYEADLDWEANHFASGFKVKGMRNFPMNADGSYQMWVQHPTEKDADGAPLRVRANIVVRRYIPSGN